MSAQVRSLSYVSVSPLSGALPASPYDTTVSLAAIWRRPGNRVSGRVAQLVERAPEKREVTGSMPVPTTNNSLVRALQLTSLCRRSRRRATHVPQLEESRRSARVNNGFQRPVVATDRDVSEAFPPCLVLPAMSH